MIPLNLGTGPLLALADASLRSIVLFLGGLLVLLALRTRRAAVRHAVWTVVACGMLVLPILSLSVPAIPLRLLPAPPLQFDPPVVAQQPVAAAAPAAGAVDPRFPDWRVVGAAGWLVVSLILCCRMMLGYFFARRLFRRGVPVELPPAMADFAGRSRHEVREAASISVPLTLGWLRPIVLLPAGWRNWDHAKLRAVVAHELAHVRRSDWLIMLLVSLNKCVFWFHPLAWWLERRLGTLAEEACDDECLLALDNREQYAQALLEMAAAVRDGQGRLGWEAMAMARASQVRKRLERVLDETRRVLPGLSRARWSAAMLCAAPVVCGLAVLQLAPAQTPEMNGSVIRLATVQAARDSAPVRVELQPQQVAPVPAGPKEYTIRVGDRLNIAVWNNPNLSPTVAVGADGKVVLPLLGGLQAAGLTPRQLKDVVSKAYAEYIVQPEITISVVQVQAPRDSAPAPRPAPEILPPVSPEDVIEAIEFRGARRVPVDTLRALIFSKKGDRMDEDALRKDFMALWETGRFDDIRMQIDPGKTGKIVVFVLTERKTIRTIAFRNLEGIPVREALDRLKKSDVALGLEQPYRPDVVEKARRVLGEMFAERGQSDVRVKAEISDIPPSSIEVVFTAYRP
jgi:beta-lactamase regulating signal transducer with metallopeptidase domain